VGTIYIFVQHVKYN